MGDDLRFLSQVVLERAKQVLRSLPSAEGHGSSLPSAVAEAVATIAADARLIAGGAQYAPAEARAKSRDLQRFIQQLDVLYWVLSMFAKDIGRTDVPIGLLHLVDELIQDLLPSGADPILHLDYSNMYSTWSIFHRVPSILDPDKRAKPHPVAFNVPGLDPGNATFAPILAHEVGHTCWQRGMGNDLRARLDAGDITAALQQAVDGGSEPRLVMDHFSNWLQELMCDALAATLTGPSFLFASTVFLPAVGEAVLGTHPYPRDRIGFTIRVLERLGWGPVLEELVPNVLSWCRELATSPDLTGSPLESALRRATGVAEPAMMALAEQTAGNRLTVEALSSAKDELFAYLDLEIPPVMCGGLPTSAWLVISAGWLHEIRHRSAEGAAALPAIAVDVRLNRFLLKTVELSGILRLWRSHAAPTS